MSASAGIILGLPGLLTSTVECFKYVQLSRNFGKDFGDCVLALDTTKLRLSRWGAALCIQQDHTADLSRYDTQELQMAWRILESIRDSFADAEAMSNISRKKLQKAKNASTEVAVFDESHLEPRFQSLHVTLHELAEQYQKTPSVLKKAKWAFYEKEKFDALIERVRGRVSDLIELFPPPKEEVQELCIQEVKTIENAEDVARLKLLVGSEDEELKEAVDEGLKQRGQGHLVEKFRLVEAARAEIGDENENERVSNGHVVRSFEGSGTSVVKIGNRNT